MSLLLIMHCLYTPEGREVSADEVLLWHTGPKSEGHRGWSRPGYRTITHLDGSKSILWNHTMDGTLEGWEITNGAYGYNQRAIHLAYVGGKRNGEYADTRTKAQREMDEYDIFSYIDLNPDIKVGGHNQLSKKQCPCYNVPDFCRSIGVKEKNIL